MPPSDARVCRQAPNVSSEKWRSATAPSRCVQRPDDSRTRQLDDGSTTISVADESDGPRCSDLRRTGGAPVAQEFPCGNCGAKLHYDAGAQAMKCPYCGFQQPIPQSQQHPASGGGREIPEPQIHDEGGERHYFYVQKQVPRMIPEAPLDAALQVRDFAAARRLFAAAERQGTQEQDGLHGSGLLGFSG